MPRIFFGFAPLALRNRLDLIHAHRWYNLKFTKYTKYACFAQAPSLQEVLADAKPSLPYGQNLTLDLALKNGLQPAHDFVAATQLGNSKMWTTENDGSCSDLSVWVEILSTTDLSDHLFLVTILDPPFYLIPKLCLIIGLPFVPALPWGV